MLARTPPARAGKSCAPRRLVRAYVQPTSNSAPPWRPSTILDEWVQREARPISLRQLTFFGRTLTKARLLDSANYARTELPTRIAHRLRDMQTLPYVVVTNSHISHVYELYYRAFEKFRRVPEIKTVEDNERYCKILRETLREHLTVIPQLTMGVLEVQGLMEPEETDILMTTLLRSRISRRVIAEQHTALTDTFHMSWDYGKSEVPDRPVDCVGEILLHCNAKDIVQRCAAATQELIKKTYGDSVVLPRIKLEGDLTATFPYIESHIEYIIGELLRNSFQAVIEQRKFHDSTPPIEVLICETSQHVIVRISDRGGGVPSEVLPCLWSFSKGPGREKRLKNLNRVPRMVATMQEIKVPDSGKELDSSADTPGKGAPTPKDDLSLPKDKDSSLPKDSSLSSLTSRPPDLRLGIGLPMSKIYAEYWAGSLEIHSLEGYGADAFLQISKLGNKNERVTTRARMDSV